MPRRQRSDGNVFRVGHNQAPAVYQAAARLRLRSLEDASAVGFADLDFVRYLARPLTTVRQDPCGIGREAARVVVERRAARPRRLRRRLRECPKGAA